jgi:hypothetical protein
MYLGYRKLFRYRHYIFQLSMESKYSKSNYIESVIIPHFCLALYGWKEDNSDMLQPYGDTIIPIDNIMSQEHWEID